MCANQPDRLYDACPRVNPDIRDKTDERSEVSAKRYPAPFKYFRLTVYPRFRRSALFPSGFFRRYADGILVSGVSKIFQPKIDRVHWNGGGDLVHKRFTAEKNRWTVWIAKMRRTQGGRPIEQRRYCFPTNAIMRKRVGGKRDIEGVARRQRNAK